MPKGYPCKGCTRVKDPNNCEKQTLSGLAGVVSGTVGSYAEKLQSSITRDETKGDKAMNNYICINDQKISLSEEQVQQIRGSFCLPGMKLADVSVADTCKIGDHEMIVLEQIDGTTLLLRKDPLRESQEFGTDNNYNGSYADDICNEFAAEIAAIVGGNNLLIHNVDLTADDGLKDYGTIQRFASILTAPQARKYVEILDKYKLDVPFWLATPWSTPTHDNKTLVKCVWPSGFVYNYCYDFGYAVRPFCILNSNIFVSQ